MMDRTDWQSVRDTFLDQDRATLGEPPTAEELLAYERGALSEADADRVRRLLVAYPELARAYATPFPDEDVTLPRDVIDRQWNAFNRRRGSGGRVLLFWRTAAAIAASLAIVFGAMLWQTRSELLRPHVLTEPNILTPDGRRGLPEEPQTTITPSGKTVLLVVSIVGPGDYDTYRLELVDGGHRRVWSSDPLRPTTTNSYHVEIPSAALRSGTYQVVAYGRRGSAEEMVATYTIEVR